MYTALDRSFLATLHITVQDISAGNMHDTSEPLLLFAPHVPKSVYEASMRQFWRQSHIGHLVLLANDVRHYPDMYVSPLLSLSLLAIAPLSLCFDISIGKAERVEDRYR